MARTIFESAVALRRRLRQEKSTRERARKQCALSATPETARPYSETEQRPPRRKQVFRREARSSVRSPTTNALTTWTRIACEALTSNGRTSLSDASNCWRLDCATSSSGSRP
jgi:hypothetical protein